MRASAWLTCLNRSRASIKGHLVSVSGRMWVEACCSERFLHVERKSLQIENKCRQEAERPLSRFAALLFAQREVVVWVCFNPGEY